jgi:hypothetical protein
MLAGPIVTHFHLYLVFPVILLPVPISSMPILGARVAAGAAPHALCLRMLLSVALQDGDTCTAALHLCPHNNVVPENPPHCLKPDGSQMLSKCLRLALLRA